VFGDKSQYVFFGIGLCHTYLRTAGAGFGETGPDEIASIHLYAVLNLDPRYNDLAPRSSGTSESASDILRRLNGRANRPEKIKTIQLKKKSVCISYILL